MAFETKKERPIGDNYLRRTATWAMEYAGLNELEHAPSPPETNPSAFRSRYAPVGGDLVIVHGDYTQYLAQGPTCVEPLDETITRKTLTDLGTTLSVDDEGDWSLPTLVWEVWFDRDTYGTLRVIGWGTRSSLASKSDTAPAEPHTHTKHLPQMCSLPGAVRASGCSTPSLGRLSTLSMPIIN